MQFIERLKTRSESTKRRYAFIGAITATLIIGMGWSTTLPARYATMSVERPEKDGDSFKLSGFLEDANSQLGSLGDGVEQNPDATPSGDTPISQDKYLGELFVPPPSPSAEVPPEAIPAPEPQPLPAPEVPTPVVPTETQPVPPPAVTAPSSENPPTAMPSNIILQPSVTTVEPTLNP